MKRWWRDLTLQNKLHLPIQITLLLVLPLAQVWLMHRLEDRMLEDVRLRAIDSATQSFLSLNAMMLSGTISDPQTREIFFRRMNTQDGVLDFHLSRSAALRQQFGDGNPGETEQDELDYAALTQNEVQFAFQRERKHHTLRVVVPFSAQRDFHGANCLNCHFVPEGTVLGAVSLSMDLEAEYRKLEKLSLMLVAAQAVLQIVLFLLIGWIIRSVTRSVVELERTMREVREFADFSRRAVVRGRDEIGGMATVFNGFLAQIEELYRQLADKIRVLEEYHDHTEEELRIGSDIMARITDAHSTNDAAVRIKISPAAYYSGDLILMARTPGGVLHVLLADAVGHGLTAAMNLLPLSQVFNAMTKKGFPVARIAEELNSKIHRLMPVDRFVGAVLISVDFREQVIEVWNGGIPAPLLVGPQGDILHRWSSRHPPLGILDEKTFSPDVEVFHFEREGQLFLFSDGLLEAESPRGEQFGKERVEQVLQQAPAEQRFDMLIAALEQHLQGQHAHDDVSLAMVSVDKVAEAEGLVCHLGAPSKEAVRSQWRVALTLGEDELKYLDAVPLITEIVSKIHAAAEHRSSLYVILTELFNNALDHGLLRLDSAMKEGEDGFERYLALREHRLLELKSGWITIEIEKVVIDGKYGLRIRVVDSGEGFDYTALPELSEEEVLLAQHGRGLALARGLAYKVEHLGKGNEVIAYYICS